MAKLTFVLSASFLLHLCSAIGVQNVVDSNSQLASLASSPSLGVRWDQWAALNRSVQGRLHIATPLSLPCFSSFNGQPSEPDPNACALVQQNYTEPDFRSEHFGSFMNVSTEICQHWYNLLSNAQSQWETCQETGSGCLLDDTNTTNPLAFKGKSCDLGNIPPYYVSSQLSDATCSL